MLLDFEDILLMNPPVTKGGNSIVEQLIKRGATSPFHLCDISKKLDEFEQLDNPHFACSFQLPYKIRLDKKRICISGKRKELSGVAEFSSASICFDNRFDVSYIENHQPKAVDSLDFTQVVIFFPYWGKRKNYYDKYTACMSEHGIRRELLVPLHASWITIGYKKEGQKIPAFSTDYENELADRVHRECHFGIGRLLIELSSISRRELRCPYPLYNYFVMPTPGRVVQKGIPKSIVMSLIDEQTPIPTITGEVNLIEENLRRRQRHVTQYELQLYSLRDVLQQGETRLCLIGVISLLEWLLNASYYPNERRQLSLTKLIRKKTLIHILASHEQILWRAIELRNSAVHGAPPTRDELFVQSKKKRKFFGMESLKTTQSNSFFNDLFDASFDIFKKVNLDEKR